jgi:DNA-binding response OmpR family regulator
MKSGQTVLAVDDEEKILELLKSYLEINGYRALCAPSGREGMALFERNSVDLVLLDLMLPDISGEAFCRKLRETADVPVIMITARADEESVIKGLRAGADDYVCKPFSPRELMARVEAALRRSRLSGGGTREDTALSYRDLAVDTANRTVSRGGKLIGLTKDEYHILALLMSRRSKIFTRDEILAKVKGGDYDGFDRTIDTHIKNLRAKLGDDPRSPRYITTVYGMGYRFGAADGSAP